MINIYSLDRYCVPTTHQALFQTREVTVNRTGEHCPGRGSSPPPGVRQTRNVTRKGAAQQVRGCRESQFYVSDARSDVTLDGSVKVFLLMR